jgi:hypothetical protein
MVNTFLPAVALVLGKHLFMALPQLIVKKVVMGRVAGVLLVVVLVRKPAEVLLFPGSGTLVVTLQASIRVQAVERVVQELSALPRCQPGVLVRPLP